MADLSMKPELVHIGFNNVVAMNRVIAIMSPDSLPIKRMMQEAREEGRLIDVTYGRRTKAVLVLDSGHVILAALQPDTIVSRLDQKRSTPGG